MPSGISKFTITVWGGRDLKVVRMGEDKCDPFVELKIGSTKLKTDPAKMTAALNPTWNKKLQVKTGGATELYLNVIDKSPMGLKLMGEGIFVFDREVVARLKEDPVLETFVHLKYKDKPAGDVKIVIANPEFEEVSGANAGKAALKAELERQVSVSMVKPYDNALRRRSGAQGTTDSEGFATGAAPGFMRLRSLESEQASVEEPSKKCPNPKCGMMLTESEFEPHEEICKFHRTQCDLCKARFYRMDSDYHNFVCRMQEVKCPLACGTKMPRGDIREHVEDEMMNHTHEKLESQDYLPEEHPTRVYGLLLRKMKELEAQLAQFKKSAGRPGTMPAFDRDLSPLYSPAKGDYFGDDGFNRQPAPSPGQGDSEWLQKYMYLVNMLQQMRGEVDEAHRAAGHQDPRAARQRFQDLQEERNEIVAAGHGMVADIEDELNHHHNKPGTTVVWIEDCQVKLDTLFDYYEELKALLQEEDRAWKSYNDDLFGDGMEEVEEA